MQGVGRRCSLSLHVAAFLALPSAALAQISVNPAILVVETSKPQTIVVTNQASEITFVTVRPRTVGAPGQTDEKLNEQPNPAQLGLLVTPIRLALEPGEQRAINLTPLDPPGDSDRVWRVQIAPAVGPLKPGQAGLSFVIAYDALVIQRANNPQPSISGQRVGDVLTLLNTGNSFAMITGIEQCRARDDCVVTTGKRLYSGQSWTTVLPISGISASARVEGIRGKREALKF